MSNETKTKRSFYNKGEAKGFTRMDFFLAMREYINDGDVTDETLELVEKAIDYEIEGLLITRDRPAGEKKDPLQSDLAIAIREKVVPLVGDTPLTSSELCEMATKKGLLSPKGTEFTPSWVSRVLNKTDGIVAVVKIVERVNAKGLRSQTEANAFKRA